MRFADVIGMRLAGVDVIEARLGGRIVWPAGGPPERRWFGNQARGDNSFGTSNNRCVLGMFVLPEAATDLVLYHFFRLNFAGACSMRGVVMSTTGGTPPQPNALIGYSDQQVIPSTEGWVPAPLSFGLAAGTYWFGAVCNSDARTMEATTAPGGSPGATRLATNFNFAAPPATWPGSAGSYVSILSSYIEYTPA